MNLKTGCFVYVLLIALSLVFSYLITAGLIYLIMWGLTVLDVVLPIAWSWGLSAVVWLILFLLKSSFKVEVKK